MPKGFLVKRTKRTYPNSYRMRQDDSFQQKYPLLVSAPNAFNSEQTHKAVQPLVCNGQLENIQSWTPFRETLGASHPCPTNVALSANLECTQQHSPGNSYGRSGSPCSPIQLEYFTEAPGKDLKYSPSQFQNSTTVVTGGLNMKLGCLDSKPASTTFTQPVTPKARVKHVHPRRDMGSSSLHQMTTSPVYGLRIKECPEQEVKQQSITVKTLGEYICQLCKERYSDPLTLAQHQCSRIVPVVYRCTECEKVFSCPANLASHRRWHKPKNDQSTEDKLKLNLLQVNKHVNILNPSSTKMSNLYSKGAITFDCTVCCKKFSRQSYLRKHLAMHTRKAASSQPSRQCTEENIAKPFNSLWKHNSCFSPGHPKPTRTDTVTDNGEKYPCKFCGDTFFSSPGLSRHINKCHSTEAAEVVFIPQRL